MDILGYCSTTNRVVLPVFSKTDIKTVRQLLNPNRLAMLALIHQRRSLTVAELMDAFGLSQKPTETGLDTLETLGLVSVSKESNPGHGLRRVITSLLPPDREFIDIRLALGSPQEPLGESPTPTSDSVPDPLSPD
ncbi:winged helix-turn-helix domain-containing protein [Marinimicrobium sp. ABcell2]|uniref:winged helix-turn-helix domain-containing protein n=1 Tax=Marinimicrobium sp. ABcell2 TaxID=3069751 RepID=UPI00359C37A6